MDTVLRSERRCDPYRHGESRRAYSFARAGSLWVPEQRRCHVVQTALTSVFPHFSTKDNPLEWPGASSLLSWHHWRFDRQYNSTLYATGSSPPAVTYTGTVPVNCGLQVDIPTGGVRGTATFRWSSDNGTNWSAPIATAASVALGNGITLQFANTGPYSTDNLYKLTISSFRDQTGNGHHWVTLDAAVEKYPVPKVTAVGTGVSFDGVNDALQCTTSFASTLVGGTDNSFYICAVLQIDNTAPTTNGALLFFGDGSTNRALIWFFSNTPQFRVSKQDDAATAKSLTGTTPTPNTSLHTMELFSSGTTATMRVDGTAVTGINGGDIDVGALTVSVATIGCTFNSGAEGNRGAVTWFEKACYTSDLDATTRADIRSRMKAPYGL